MGNLSPKPLLCPTLLLLGSLTSCFPEGTGGESRLPRGLLSLVPLALSESASSRPKKGMQQQARAPY